RGEPPQAVGEARAGGPPEADEEPVGDRHAPPQPPRDVVDAVDEQRALGVRGHGPLAAVPPVALDGHAAVDGLDPWRRVGVPPCRTGRRGSGRHDPGERREHPLRRGLDDPRHLGDEGLPHGVATRVFWNEANRRPSAVSTTVSVITESRPGSGACRPGSAEPPFATTRATPGPSARIRAPPSWPDAGAKPMRDPLSGPVKSAWCDSSIARR